MGRRHTNIQVKTTIFVLVVMLCGVLCQVDYVNDEDNQYRDENFHYRNELNVEEESIDDTEDTDDH